MSNSPILTRQQIAESFNDTARSICGEVRFDQPLGELVLSVTDAKYIGSALPKEIDSDDNLDSPRAWRFMVPATSNPMALVPIEFGVATTDLDGHTQIESRFTHEMAIDADLRLNEDDLVIKGLFGAVGGHIVKRVNDQNETFFSAIERRYRPQDDNMLAVWSHVVYPRQLLHTSRLIEDYINLARSHGVGVSEDLHRLSLSKNRFAAAKAMAISGLVASLGV